MKCLFFLLVSLFLLGQNSYCQNNPADCRQLLDNIIKKLDDRIKIISNASKIEKVHLEQLDAWFTELKGIADNNSFGLFTNPGLASQTCAYKFKDILRNFFKSGNQYLFQPNKYPALDECTGSFADEDNTVKTMENLKRLSFILRAVYPLFPSNVSSS
jgi:hypothetical protein